MIVVRDVFRLKFGQAREVKAAMLESQKLMTDEQLKNSRVLFDLVGPAYTMVLENTYTNLAHYEKELAALLGKPEWKEWYQKLIPRIEQSYREIFTVME